MVQTSRVDVDLGLRRFRKCAKYFSFLSDHEQLERARCNSEQTILEQLLFSIYYRGTDSRAVRFNFFIKLFKKNTASRIMCSACRQFQPLEARPDSHIDSVELRSRQSQSIFSPYSAVGCGFFATQNSADQGFRLRVTRITFENPLFAYSNADLRDWPAVCSTAERGDCQAMSFEITGRTMQNILASGTTELRSMTKKRSALASKTAKLDEALNELMLLRERVQKAESRTVEAEHGYATALKRA